MSNGGLIARFALLALLALLLLGGCYAGYNAISEGFDLFGGASRRAEIDANARVKVAQAEAQAQTQIAQTNAQAQTAIAQSQAQSQIAVADSNAQASTARAVIWASVVPLVAVVVIVGLLGGLAMALGVFVLIMRSPGGQARLAGDYGAPAALPAWHPPAAAGRGVQYID